MNPVSTSLWRGLGALYVFFLLTPLVLVVLFAFTDRGISNFPINHVSLQWWDAMPRSSAVPAGA